MKPNVLFILADDLGWGDVSFHNSQIKTPNIDRLAQTGVELQQHYVCPVCTPTRISLLTGIYPSRFGQHATVPSNEPVLPDNFRTMASMFKSCGYSTGLFGKWHLGSDVKYIPNNYGFDYSYGSIAGGVDPYTHLYKEGQYSKTWHRNGEFIDEYGHVSDLIINEAQDWISNQSTPWFCYVPFTAVHTPINAPENWISKYWLEKFDADADRDRSYKIYAAYTSHMDHCVGQLVEKLKILNQLDNTIIIFASDNGASTKNGFQDTALYPGRHDDMPRTGSNYPLHGNKAQVFEGGIRTPACISWAGKLKPRKHNLPIHIADWLPTFASILDHDLGNEISLDGQDISSIIFDDVDTDYQRTLYWNLNHSRFAVRKGDWKLIVREDETYLFDIKNDPLEERNQVINHPEIVESLKTTLAQLHQNDDCYKRSDVV